MEMSTKLLELINTYEGNDIDLCYYVYESLSNGKMQETLAGLKLFLEEVRGAQSDKSMKLENQVTDEELLRFHKDYGNYINESLRLLVTRAHLQMWTVDRFYEVLWNRLINDDLFDDIKINAFVLLCLAQSPLLPFFELDMPLKMENKKFSFLIQKQKASVQRVRHILELGLSQKTEVSSLILKELLNVTDYESQIVLLAIVLDEAVKAKLKGLPGFMQEIEVEKK